MHKKLLFHFLVGAVLGTFFVPMANAAPVYAFPIVGCTVKYAHSHHNYPVTDILAKKGCRFVATTSGTVDEVNRVDKWSGKTNSGADRGTAPHVHYGISWPTPAGI